MRLRGCLLLLPLACFWSLAPTNTSGYQTHYVERDCRSGNLTVRLSGATGPDSAALLRATDRTSYSLAIDCRIAVLAPDDHRIVVAIRKIGFRKNSDGTCKDYLVIDEQDVQMCAALFRVDEERHVYSAEDRLQMRYHVSRDDVDNLTLTGHPGFEVTLTAFAEGVRCPSDGPYRCENGNCIWSGLRCDSHNNCGDLSDERDCGTGSGSNSMVLVILGALIFLLLLLMCVATLVCAKNESVRRLSNRIRSRTLTYLRRFSR